MLRLSNFITAHRWLVLACWGITLLAAAPFAARQTDHLTGGGFLVPGSQSARVEALLSEHTEATPNEAILIVSLSDSEAAVNNAIERDERVIAQTSGVRKAQLPLPLKVGKTEAELIPLRVFGDLDQRIGTATALLPLIHADEAIDGTRSSLVGQDALWAAMHKLSTRQLTSAERIGLPITLVLLVLVFGALAAAALPLILGIASVTITGAAIFFLSQATSMSLFVTNAASMLGIGVAVDYSLFILARYREAVRDGADEETARHIALRTSGSAVVFSGLTVIVALLGLFLVNSVTIRSMALGMIVVVAVSLLGAITLTPALIAVLGHRVTGRGALRRLLRWPRGLARIASRSAGATDRGDFWARWTERVMRRPLLAVVLTSTIMLALAVPLLSLHLNVSAITQFPRDDPSRTATELSQRALGPGVVAPIQELARFTKGTPVQHTALTTRWIAATRARPSVGEIGKPEMVEDGHAVLVTITLKVKPESRAAENLVDELRNEAVRRQGLASSATVSIGGAVADNQDFVTLIEKSTWRIALFILVLSYLVLLLMLRSLVLPVKAILMTMLSVASASGVLVILYQWGWVAHLLGGHPPGYVESTTPPLLLTLVFGLSMDYEVFMLSRIKEAYRVTGDTRSAVALGLRKCAATVTSAALIMVSVFAAFAAISVPSVKELGVGLAIAITLDATLVRLILVPATMELLGRWNWWLPRRLHTLLPLRSIEGQLDSLHAGKPDPAFSDS